MNQAVCLYNQFIQYIRLTFTNYTVQSVQLIDPSLFELSFYYTQYIYNPIEYKKTITQTEDMKTC